MARPIRVLVTGGGTGGHTVPALATVARIREMSAAKGIGSEAQILYVGSSAGLESRLAREAGLTFCSIATGKLRRSANPLRMLSRANVLDAARVPLGFAQALLAVQRFRPDVVFSTGGYVAVPAVVAAGVLGRPVIMHEQTVQIGLANRLCARFATRIALSYPESAQELSVQDRAKSFVTGGVVRKIVVDGNASRGRDRFGFVGALAQLPVVYITGGAQGSSVLNMAVLESLPELVEKCCIIHQCGRQTAAAIQDEDKLKAASRQLADDRRDRYVVAPFIGDEIGDVYAASSLVIGRSGAGTVSEVCAVGRPSALVPLVPTGGDEQTRNARRLQEAGAAVLIKQNEINGKLLNDTVGNLLGQPERLATMSAAALSLSTPDAVDVLASAVMELAARDKSVRND